MWHTSRCHDIGIAHRHGLFFVLVVPISLMSVFGRLQRELALKALLLALEPRVAAVAICVFLY